ncbi:MAG: hypothetical protein GY822_04515 [Deltaproteobacteria bacterium]|nr:hypothetical protein [Deltaproteobacteria bacterium]
MNSSSQSSFYVVTRLLLFTVIGSTLLSACGPSGPPPDPRQVKLENEIRNLEATKRKLQHDAKAFQAIERAQKANKPVVTATFAGRDLEKALDRAMPITFPAKQLSSYVSGTVRVLGIKNVKLDGNKGRFQLVAKGKNIKINTAIPLGYQTMAKELIASLKSGVTINVKGEVFLATKAAPCSKAVATK